jgi:hypothetical protein
MFVWITAVSFHMSVAPTHRHSCHVCICKEIDILCSLVQENTVFACVGSVAHMFVLLSLLVLSQGMGIEFILLVECRWFGVN